jgi:hypothetical protein
MTNVSGGTNVPYVTRAVNTLRQVPLLAQHGNTTASRFPQSLLRRLVTCHN